LKHTRNLDDTLCHDTLCGRLRVSCSVLSLKEDIMGLLPWSGRYSHDCLSGWTWCPCRCPYWDWRWCRSSSLVQHGTCLNCGRDIFMWKTVFILDVFWEILSYGGTKEQALIRSHAFYAVSDQSLDFFVTYEHL